jgi:CHAT domain-containing protein
LRGGIKIEDWKRKFTEKRLKPYDGIIRVLLHLNHLTDAFHYVQRAKARAFLDQLGNTRVNPRATDNPDLVDKEETLRDEIQALNTRLREEWGKPECARSKETINNLKSRLQEKRDAYEDLLIRLKLENPEYASLITVETSTLTETQRLLTDTTLIEYYVGPTQTLAFVITEDEFQTEVISVTRESLSMTAGQFFTETQTTLQGIPTSLQTLYDTLLAPVEPHLTTEQILIAPHDVLHYVPFAALHDGGQYFIERHTLTKIPSASVLPFILKKVTREESGGPPLILGDPDGSLPFGRQEAQTIAELYNTTAYVGSKAMEKIFWEKASDAGVLHLSTHGVYNPNAPIFSRVLLTTTTTNEQDGILEVHEIYNLDLSNADLAVLSACQTNLGKRSAGDEIVGLTRAFIYAGVPSVVSTLWNVEDEATSDLMVAFYGYLQDGLPKAEALRQAQLDLLEEPDTAHPFYWAGFVLSGDGRAQTRIREPQSLLRRMRSRLLVLGSGGCCTCCLPTLVVVVSFSLVVRWGWHKIRGGG